MKTPSAKLLLAALLIVNIFSGSFSAHAQGALTPSGAPAATMKSLTQIEPRTPISSAPFAINSSGSYYLTTNLTVSSSDAIDIYVGGVTLDLNGFTITSTAPFAGGAAITVVGGRTNISIYNGHINSGVTNTAAGVYSGSGFSYGIVGNNSYNMRVKDVSVIGVLNHGIVLNIGNATVVEGCTVNVAGNYGIVADSVSDSTAFNCGLYGINADTALNCKGSAVGAGTGVAATIANNCYGSSSSGAGLNASTANNCIGASFDGTGLIAFIASVCHGTSTSGTPLSVTHNVNSF